MANRTPEVPYPSIPVRQPSIIERAWLTLNESFGLPAAFVGNALWDKLIGARAVSNYAHGDIPAALHDLAAHARAEQMNQDLLPWKGGATPENFLVKATQFALLSTLLAEKQIGSHLRLQTPEEGLLTAIRASCLWAAPTVARYLPELMTNFVQAASWVDKAGATLPILPLVGAAASTIHSLFSISHDLHLLRRRNWQWEHRENKQRAKLPEPLPDAAAIERDLSLAQTQADRALRLHQGKTDSDASIRHHALQNWLEGRRREHPLPPEEPFKPNSHSRFPIPFHRRRS